MITEIVNVPLIVRDYDEAIAFYTRKLAFRLVENTDMGNGKRWVQLEAPGKGGSRILLSRAVNDEQRSRIGNQTGGRVLFFMYTDDFESDYAALKSGGVTISEEARDENHGRVAVFKDLYGNRVDLIQPKAEKSETISVEPDLTLEKVHARFSSELFELVSGQREYLSEFLWWPQTIRTLDDARQYLASVGQEMKKGSALNYFIFQGGRLSGGCGFSLQMKYTRAEMGFWLEKESQGQGIMSRCLTTMIRYGFEELGLHRLELRIAPENTRSLTLARKMHFLTEGRMRDALRIGGSYQDMIVHALLKREWTEYQSRPEM